MKKNLSLFVAFVLLGATAFGQAVKDRQVVPVAVSLNQVLRMNITNGGNIEFVFNSIDDYELGLSADQLASTSANTIAAEGFYQTDFTVSSSTRWSLTYGAENGTFIGTDNPANTLTLDNVGFDLVNGGNHIFEAAGAVKATNALAQLFSIPTDNSTQIAALQPYPIVLLEDNDVSDNSNAGDAINNNFSLLWRCGTSEGAGATVPMNAVSILDQQPSPTPDRYVTNVLFELAVDNL